MLRVLSAILFFIVLALSFVFLQQNYSSFDQAVEIQYNILVYKIEPIKIPVYALMVLSWISGVLITFCIELVAWFRVRAKISQQTKTIKRMERELQDLRTLPLTDTGTGGETVTEE